MNSSPLYRILHGSAILSISIVAAISFFFAGCATTARNPTGSIAIQVPTVSRQIVGKSADVKATVISTGAATGTLGAVTWGLNGANYSCPLTGVSTSEIATLSCPSTLAAGNYPLTASVSGVTATSTLQVVDLAAIYAEVATASAPAIKAGFMTGTYLVLKNNPDLATTFSVSTTAVSAILCANDPTASGFKAALVLAYPDMDDGITELVATALESAYTSMNTAYKAHTGDTKNLSISALFSGSQYAAATNTLITAAIEGAQAGVAAFKSSRTTD